jgi:hypothetical protein
MMLLIICDEREYHSVWQEWNHPNAPPWRFDELILPVSVIQSA